MVNLFYRALEKNDSHFVIGYDTLRSYHVDNTVPSAHNQIQHHQNEISAPAYGSYCKALPPHFQHLVFPFYIYGSLAPFKPLQHGGFHCRPRPEY